MGLYNTWIMNFLTISGLPTDEEKLEQYLEIKIRQRASPTKSR
jgi:hypothetical protein